MVKNLVYYTVIRYLCTSSIDFPKHKKKLGWESRVTVSLKVGGS